MDENPKLDGKQPNKRKGANTKNKKEIILIGSSESLSGNPTRNDSNLHGSGDSSARSQSVIEENSSIALSSQKPMVVKEMPLSAFENSMYTNFLLTHLLKTQPVIASWLTQHVMDLSTPAATTSVRALSTTYFGRVHNEQAITARGTIFYVQALRHLNSDLQDKNKCTTSLSVLRVVDTFKLLEHFAFDNRAGWMKHASGIGRLIELRGPHAFQNANDRVHLEDNKAAIAISSLMSHKRCFLSNPDWRTIPWQHDSELKTTQMHLNDSFCDIPDLVADGRALLKATSSPTPPPASEIAKMGSELAAKIMRVLGTLYAWRARWEADNPTCCTEVHTNSPLFPTQLRFTALQHAREFIAYDGILLLLLELGSRVMGSAFSPASAATMLAPRPRPLQPSPLMYPGDEEINRQSVALEVCRCAQCFLDDDGSDFGPFYLAFPLVLAKGVFRGEGPIEGWLASVIGQWIDIKVMGQGEHYLVGGENIGLPD